MPRKRASTRHSSMVRWTSADPAERSRRSWRRRSAASRHSAASAPAFMDALPKLEIVASFGVGYDSVDAAHAGKTRRDGDQHARRADRGGGRHRARPADQYGPRAAARGELSARGTLGEGGAVPADAGDAARPPGRHLRHGPHRAGDSAAARGVRSDRRLSQPPAGRRGWPTNIIRRWCRWPARSTR